MNIDVISPLPEVLSLSLYCNAIATSEGRCGESQPNSESGLLLSASDGFTLMELLIVISIILILMLMSIPTVGSMTKRANETSAVKSLQTIVTAEMMYANTHPQKGFTCSLSALGGEPGAGEPTADAAQLIQADLASGNKAGYIFTISKCIKSGTDYVKGYAVTAVPETVGRTGDRGFCIDQDGGSPMYDPAGGTSCTQWALQ
jgi:type IV pilus assembly protein PilA